MVNINIEFLYNEDHKRKDEIIKNISEIYSNLKNIFEDDLENINIRIHNNRETFDKFNGRKTDTWIIGNVNSKQEIDLISEELMEKEKYHKREDFYPLIKHELAHLFVHKKTTSCKNTPLWLDEGMAEHLSRDNKKARSIYIPEDFFEKNVVSDNWDDSVSKNIHPYQISLYFVIFLLDRYGFKDLIKLLERLNKEYDETFFRIKFKEVFHEDFENIKKDFYNLYNKK